MRIDFLPHHDHLPSFGTRPFHITKMLFLFFVIYMLFAKFLFNFWSQHTNTFVILAKAVWSNGSTFGQLLRLYWPWHLGSFWVYLVAILACLLFCCCVKFSWGFFQPTWSSIGLFVIGLFSGLLLPVYSRPDFFSFLGAFDQMNF